ncbi:DEAD/DEAH box helicase domain protein [Desulfofarcimen acetoxidans DSM 771]|uniref:DEAD/DEAH box helicase domain protein n=1 Tax=Desulfofarcimen acetoxidans (strain ATCC 49208 / DSM 771 / KCTC 5769 / VKM B-1644 / 5575) TaxID=485916 RepID=C8VZ01_DESAS|nr:DEAD/DEAH box helicase [Desulfofarcimen acetoxidans]ACV62911.1 DEAD/DEAH box helicase domain protein [Desulfofarcimen acetoxidans DSM 771]
MVAKKTNDVKEKMLDTLLLYGPIDIIQLCARINSTPDLIIGALQSILFHKDLIMTRSEVNNRITTWVAHKRTQRKKLLKIADLADWTDKKTFLNLKKLRKQLTDGNFGDIEILPDRKQAAVKKAAGKNFSTANKLKAKSVPAPMIVYKMLPEQVVPQPYIGNDLTVAEEQIDEIFGLDTAISNHDSPFKLDKFQRVAINAVLAGNLVLVSAPTGTGKTLIAEKLAEQLLENNLRMIYTSPLKALSNQKYRDFKEMFGPDRVGLVTGDVSINGSALLLVMTTEIFRNKCFGEPEELAGVGYVVFDEIHYLDDLARGTAWEESIIFAPQQVKILGLSATVPNIAELAGWIASVRKTQVIVVEEKIRIVPLEMRWLTAEGKAVDMEEAEKAIEDYIVAKENLKEQRFAQEDRPDYQKKYDWRRGLHR